MRNFIALGLTSVFLGLSLTVAYAAQDLKTAVSSFTHEFEVSILGGKLYYRAKEGSPKWELLGDKGLPSAPSNFLGLGGFEAPAAVTELSADGDNLIAIGSDSIVYYMKWGTRKWIHTWGMPFSKHLQLPENVRSWSISHRGPFAGGYDDIDGNFHPVSAGVTTMYVLEEGGLSIRYADPWLPADFSHEICGPLRNRFRSRAMTSSASTVFVISDGGEMYTRLADFDTLGHDPFLAYSYERRVRDIPNERDVRTLPPEEWKHQPSISLLQGRPTSAITIFQTGKGNASRELRVEGINAQGERGYFAKSINGETWSFTQTDAELGRSLLFASDGGSDLGPDHDQHFSGSLKLGRLFGAKKYQIALKDFNPLCSGATLVIKIGSETLEFPLHTTTASQLARKIKGAVTLSDEVKAKAAGNKELQAFVSKFFGEKSFVNIKLKIAGDGSVSVRSRSLFSLFPKIQMQFSKIN